MNPIAPRSFNGFRQSAKTSEGFDKMRRRGIVLPPFQVEQAAAKLARGEIEALIADLRKHLILASLETGVGVRDSENELVTVAIERIREQLATLNAAGDLNEDETRIRLQLSRQLAEAQNHFFVDFFEDASERLQTRVAYALDKNDVFKDRLDGIRKGYLDTAVTRISEGKSMLRKRFIGILEQWIGGERPDLDGLDGLMDKIRGEGLNFSKFFARDQFSRFNKALMVASYEEAGAKWIRWAVVGDARTRKAHKALNGKIFAIDDLPKEYLDYNCFVPETVVQGSFCAGFKVLYSGPLFDIETARGNKISVTPNHPILTTRGWVRAKDIDETDYVISYEGRGDFSGFVEGVDEKNGPALIKDVFQTILSKGSRPRAVVGLDFHGDSAFFKSKVNIVCSDGKLSLHKTPRRKGIKDQDFERTGKSTFLVRIKECISRFCLMFKFRLRDDSALGFMPSSGALADDKFSRSLDESPFHFFSFGLPSEFHTTLGQSSKDDASITPKFLAELQDTSAGQITRDKVVNVRSRHFDGHVYDLQAVDGWIIANNIVTSNCRCGFLAVFELTNSMKVTSGDNIRMAT